MQQALKSYAVVFDAVYTPKETRLLREAAECGAIVVSGLEMFIRQAMGQFEHFTGMPGSTYFLAFSHFSIIQVIVSSSSYIISCMIRRYSSR